MDTALYRHDCGKCIWLITSSACSPNITSQMLHDAGIQCDECYSVSWRESKYTLIHLKRKDRVRLSKLKRAMRKLDESFNVKGSCIMGYNTLSSNEKEASVTDHPGFKRMVELLNANSEELESYLDKGTIFTNKKGMLWKYIEGTDPRLMTRVQLEARVRKLTPLVAEVARIRSENDNLTHILGSAQDQIVFLTSKTDDLFGKLIDKTEECATYKQRLIDRGIDPRC